MCCRGRLSPHQWVRLLDGTCEQGQHDAKREVITITKEADQRQVVSVTQANRELEVAKLWILMLEDRRLAVRRLEGSKGKGAGKPPPDPVEPPPSNSSVPQLPDWLSSLQ